MNRKTLMAGMAVLAAMTTTLTAQNLKVDRDVLTQGQTVEVSYSDPKHAGKTIVIIASDGGVLPSTEEIRIVLDKNGEGSVRWTVPKWTEANLTPPAGSDITLPCLPA